MMVIGTGQPVRWLVALGLSATVLLVCGCVGPTVTDDGYRNKVVATARQISSALASAKLAVGLELDGKMALALTDQTVSDAESDADSAQAALESRQPPSDAALALHARANEPIQQAVDALQGLRIAVRRGQPSAIRDGWQGLDQPARAMDQLQQAVSR
jgi:hypothetical protein